MSAKISKFILLSMVFGSITLTPPAIAEPFQHKFGELREYHKHWLAVCPDRFNAEAKTGYFRQCWASTYTGKPDFFLDSRLSVIRDRITGELSITAVTSAYDKLDKSQPTTVRFSDGTRMDFAFDTSVRQARSINVYQLAVENSQEMVSAMKRTNWMTLTFPTKDGPLTTSYSMIGLTAALVFTEKYASPSN